MSKRALSALWILSGLVALVLLVITIGLAVKARTEVDQGVTVYLTSTHPLILLLDTPNQAGVVVTMVDRGTEAIVIDSIVEDGQAWYQVKTEEGSGWVEAEYISLTPP